MNELTVREYLDNRQKYIEQGRAIESNAAQQAAREKAFVDKVDELQDAGLSLKEAEEQAEKWLDTQAAVHNPDQVAGGYASNVGGVGDKGVNSSISSQWRYRIDDVDAQGQYIGIVKYKNGNFVMLAKNFKRFIQNLGDDYFIEKYFQIPQYIEAVNKLGKLEQDECFGYVPLLGLGGSEKVQNLKKVKIREYIELISQLVGKIGM